MKSERFTKKNDKVPESYVWNRDLVTKTFVILGRNKLGQLEDIEEKRQVDFKILDEALEKGVYARCKDGNIRYLGGFVSFYKSHGVYWIKASNCLWQFTAPFAQYGNSWAITKEELE